MTWHWDETKKVWVERTNDEERLLHFVNFVIDKCNSKHHWEESLGRIKAEAVRIRKEVEGE